MTDVDISDILLTVARQISKSLTAAKIELNPTGFQGLLQKTWSVLQSDVNLSVESDIPAIGKVGASTTGEFSADLLGIGKFSAKLKGNPDARARLRQHLEPQTDNLLELINKELLEPANKALQERGQKGIVAIVDSLDRPENTKERNQAEYIFVTRGEKLRQFHCHIVYTTPLVLNFSNSIAPLAGLWLRTQSPANGARQKSRQPTPHRRHPSITRHGSRPCLSRSALRGTRPISRPSI
ncbi:MAG: hypothetical protein ACK5CM_08935 [Pseudanabaena sp.]